jgi:hypothetical protein
MLFDTKCIIKFIGTYNMKRFINKYLETLVDKRLLDIYLLVSTHEYSSQGSCLIFPFMSKNFFMFFINKSFFPYNFTSSHLKKEWTIICFILEFSIFLFEGIFVQTQNISLNYLLLKIITLQPLNT